MLDSEVLITSDPAKLPAEIVVLLDPAQPLPEGVIFYEKQFDLADIVRTLLIAIGLALAALIVIPIGVAVLFQRQPVTVTSHVNWWPLGFGLVLALGAWMMFASLGTSWKLRKLQQQGQCTRRGTFITAAALIQASENDTTIIPPSCFRGLKGNAVKYHHNDADKSYNLPRMLVNASPADLHTAITRWSSARPDDQG